MLRLIEFGILIVALVLVLRVIRGRSRPPSPPDILPPEPPNEHPGQKHDNP